MYAGLAPVRGAGDLRRHHLHGHRQRRVRPRGRHARAARGAGRRGREGGRDVPLRHPGRADPPRARARRGAVRGVRLADGEVVDADAVVANPDLPVAYRTLLPGLADAAGGPPGRLLAVGPRLARRRPRRRCPPGTEHHNIHFGRDWDGAFRAILRDGVRMPDPVAARQRARRCTSRRWRPTGAPRALRARADAQPRRHGRLDRRARRGPRRPRRATSSGSATRPTSRSRSSSTRSTGRRRGWSGARRSPCRTGSARPGPFRPGNLERRAPGLVFAGSGTVPGRRRADGAGVGHARGRSGSRRWRPDERHARRELRPLPGAEQALRHHLLLVDLRAAAGEAPPRVGALRLLPPRRRHRRRPRARPPSRCARRRWPTSATASSPTSTPGAPTTRCSRRSCTPCAPSTSTRTASAGSCARWRWTSPSPATRPGTTCSATWTARPR